MRVLAMHIILLNVGVFISEFKAKVIIIYVIVGPFPGIPLRCLDLAFPIPVLSISARREITTLAFLGLSF
jgi:hypothetical protein